MRRTLSVRMKAVTENYHCAPDVVARYEKLKGNMVTLLAVLVTEYRMINVPIREQ